jgi:D-sedoheptulose 7-phosphate isomerase
MRGFAATLADLLTGTEASDSAGRFCAIDEAVEWAALAARATHDRGNKLIFIGNGGSAGIASHMAADYSKNANLRALAMNDSSMLTCLGNDYGYEQVFAKQIEFHGRPGDFLVALSSSGRSENILSAVKVARGMECTVMTLSGFTPDNPLRALGDMNLFLASDAYIFVEVGHMALCHAILEYSIERCGGGATGQRP